MHLHPSMALTLSHHTQAEHLERAARRRAAAGPAHPDGVARRRGSRTLRRLVPGRGGDAPPALGVVR